jgi:hypothetical protein
MRGCTRVRRNLSVEAISAQGAIGAVAVNLLVQMHLDDIFDQKLAGYASSLYSMRKPPKGLERECCSSNSKHISQQALSSPYNSR